MWNHFCLKFNKVLTRYRLNKELNPDSFNYIAQEIFELSDLAARLWPGDHNFQAQIKNIQKEMSQLKNNTKHREFKKLSLQKKLELKSNLLKSKEQILATLRSAPASTKRIQ